MGFNPKRDEIEGNLFTPQRKKPRLGDDGNANPVNDLSNDQQLWSEAVDPDSCEILIPKKARNMLNGKTTLDDLFACYPVIVQLLSMLDRTDFRSMQLAGLGLRIGRNMQRKHLISIPCSNHALVRLTHPKHVVHLGFLARIGWLPAMNCHNTTETMDEIKPCTGKIWPANFRSGSPEAIDSCRHPHFNATKNGSSYNVCLDCNQLAAQHMSPLEHRRIPRLRRTLCSKHTSENTPLARQEPCKCMEILDTEWRCWGCRKSTRRGLMAIAMRRRNFLDESNDEHCEDECEEDEDDQGDHWSDQSSDSGDSEDRDKRDDWISRDRAHFCPISGCQEWIKTQDEEALKMCLACETILLPSVEDDDDE